MNIISNIKFQKKNLFKQLFLILFTKSEKKRKEKKIMKSFKEITIYMLTPKLKKEQILL